MAVTGAAGNACWQRDGASKMDVVTKGDSGGDIGETLRRGEQAILIYLFSASFVVPATSRPT